MARLKFLFFALVFLGLWASQLFLLSPAVGARSVEQASSEAQLAPALVSARLDARRMEIQRTALKVAGSPALLSAFPAPTPKGRQQSQEVEAPDADRMREVRSAVSPVVPEAFRRDFVMALVNEAGAVLIRGDDQPKPLPPGLDAAALAKAGGDGLVHDAFGLTHVFYSFPVAMPDSKSGEVHTLATVVVGAPLVATGLLPDIAKQTGLGAVVLVKNGKVVSSAGPENGLAEEADKALKDGQTAVISRGSLSPLGPLRLPLLTQGDTMGGSAPLAVGARKAVEGTPLEVLGIVSTKPALQPLAVFQRMSLFGLGGLLGLFLIGLIIMGSPRAAGAEESEEPTRRGDTLGLTPTQLPPAQPQVQPLVAVAGGAPIPQQPYMGQPAPVVPLNGSGPHAVAAFDASGSPPPAPAYDFAPPPVPSEWDSAPPPVAQTEWSGPHSQPPAGDFFAAASAVPPPAPAPDFFAAPPTQEPQDAVYAPPPPPAVPQKGVPSFDTLTTRAYPVPTQADIDSYSGGHSAGPLPFNEEPAAVPLPPPPSTPETTRVSPIPDELLRQTATPSPLDMPPPPAAPAVQQLEAIPLPGATQDPEELHFQQVYQEFVATREKCGEAADGLTYEKFVQKLRKNKEQLVQKYNCKTVRFVVYVKEGKAALKATPVKE